MGQKTRAKRITKLAMGQSTPSRERVGVTPPTMFHHGNNTTCNGLKMSHNQTNKVTNVVYGCYIHQLNQTLYTESKMGF